MQPNGYHSQFIGPQLRAARDQVGMKQAELARRLGVDPAMVSRWEFVASTRYVPVPVHHFEALALHLHVSIDELIPGLRLNNLEVTTPNSTIHLPPPEANGVDHSAPPTESPITPHPAGSPPTFQSVLPMVRDVAMPGRLGAANEDGLYRLRLRCPWCRTLNVTLSADPHALPSLCLGCGGQMRALVVVNIPRP